MLVLIEREQLELDYKENPGKYKGFSEVPFHSYSYSDLEYHGVKITELRQDLSKKVRNQNLKTNDFKLLLYEMTNPYTPYVNSYEDQKKNTRYFITSFGKDAHHKIQNDPILVGYRIILDKTQQPHKKSTRKHETRIKRRKRQE